jgi:uncharacterized membrane protein HdeD (DUF308 family)
MLAPQTKEIENMNGMVSGQAPIDAVVSDMLIDELKHLRKYWIWLLLLGVLLVVCGTACIVFPALTMVTSFAAMVVLGICLMVAGVATVVGSFWAGKWSGFMVSLLIGILYVVVGFMITNRPAESSVLFTLFLAAFFILAGLFRSVSALVVKYPLWGWSLLNGLVTLLLGIIIYRHFPESGLWVIGLLVGIEMLLHGWCDIMLALAVRKIPADRA